MHIIILDPLYMRHCMPQTDVYTYHVKCPCSIHQIVYQLYRFQDGQWAILIVTKIYYFCSAPCTEKLILCMPLYVYFLSCLGETDC